MSEVISIADIFGSKNNMSEYEIIETAERMGIAPIITTLMIHHALDNRIIREYLPRQ